VDVVFIVAVFLIVLGVMTPQLWRQTVEGYAQMRGRRIT
jgi:hypothetical protein